MSQDPQNTESSAGFQKLSQDLRRAQDENQALRRERDLARRQLQQGAMELRQTNQELEQSQAELMASKVQLEALNLQLRETNAALSVLARNLEQDRADSEKRMVQRIRSMIMPLIERLQGDRKLAQYQVDLDILAKEIENLTDGLGEETKITASLTMSELRIASMIKNGMTSREISDHLNISLDTVKTHRRNIRRKLNINSSNQNLRTFLASKMAQGEANPQP